MFTAQVFTARVFTVQNIGALTSFLLCLWPLSCLDEQHDLDCKEGLWQTHQ